MNVENELYRNSNPYVNSILKGKAIPVTGHGGP
jgi:hypothetical protein